MIYWKFKYSRTQRALAVGVSAVHVELKRNSTTGLSKNSIILFEQLKTIDKRRIIKKQGEVPRNLLGKINKALKISLDIN